MNYSKLSTLTLTDIPLFIDENHKSDFLPFNSRHPSTITLVISFNKQINKKAIFHMLPITYNPEFGVKRRALLYSGVPGAILNSRYMNMQRGPCFKGSFKNSVICDVSTNVKNINVKISNNSFQMCGASSIEDGKEAAKIIINNIQKLLWYQIRMIKNQSHVFEILDWLKLACKGNEKYIMFSKITQIIRNKIKGRKTKIMETYAVYGHELLKPLTIPENFDMVLVNFFLKFIEDIHFNNLLYEHYIAKITEIIYMDLAIETKLEHFFKSDYLIGLNFNTMINICDVNVIMVNYNYNIGHRLNRFKLVEIASKLELLGVFAEFNSEYVNHASIDILYQDNDDMNIKRNPKKPTHHSLICYKTGSITQSSGSIEMAEEAYNILKYICDNFRNEIEDKTLEFLNNEEHNENGIYEIFKNINKTSNEESEDDFENAFDEDDGGNGFDDKEDGNGGDDDDKEDDDEEFEF